MPCTYFKQGMTRQ